MIVLDIEFLTIEEMKDKFKVSTSTIQSWMKSGMPYIKTGGRIRGNVRFNLQEVMKWMNNNNWMVNNSQE